jgi:hypothetical protein
MHNAPTRSVEQSKAVHDGEIGIFVDVYAQIGQCIVALLDQILWMSNQKLSIQQCARETVCESDGEFMSGSE